MNLLKSFSFRKAVFAAAAGFALQQMAAEPMRIKVATVAPAHSTWDIEQNTIAQEWARVTDGEVILQYMSATAMGGEGGVVQKLKTVRPGQKPPISGGVFTGSGINSLVPESGILTISMPGIFNNQKEVDEALKEFSAVMKKPIEDKGYVVLGWFCVGWAYYATKEEVRTPQALKRLRINFPSNETDLSNTFASAGYNVIDIPAEKVTQSMKTAGGIESIFTVPLYTYAARYYKSLNYILSKPLGPVMSVFFISKDSWNKIPEKYRPQLMEAVKKSERKLSAAQEKTDAEYIQKCVDDGATFVKLTPAEDAAFDEQYAKDSRMMFSAKNCIVNKSLYDQMVEFTKKRRGN